MFTIEYNNFKLELEFLGSVLSMKSQYKYRFWDLEFRTEPIFSGGDFHDSPLNEIESFQTAAALLGFLAVTFDDVESEFFANYNEVQQEWLSNWTERIEELKLLKQDIEQWGDLAQELYDLSNDDDDNFDKLLVILVCTPGNEYKLYTDKFEPYPIDLTTEANKHSSTYIAESATETECLSIIFNLYQNLED